MIFTLIRGFVILFIAVVITYFFSFIEKIPGSIIVEIKDKNFIKKDQIIISKIGEYVVSDQYSQTINNEKKLIDILTSLIRSIEYSMIY